MESFFWFLSYVTQLFNSLLFPFNQDGATNANSDNEGFPAARKVTKIKKAEEAKTLKYEHPSKFILWQNKLLCHKILQQNLAIQLQPKCKDHNI